MPSPARFQDTENSSLNEERKTELAYATSMPAFGMSFVGGGSAFDSGSLPQSPFPVVLLP
jgi:hypothetical protein